MGTRIRRSPIILLAIAACQSGSLSAPQLYQQLGAAGCQQVTRCGLIGRSEQQSCVDGSAAFYARYGMFTEIVGGIDVEAELDAGRLEIDPVKVSACASVISNSPCVSRVERLEPVDPACVNLYRGLVPLGGTCTDARECAQGYCAFPTHNSCASGTCTALITEGSSCAFTSMSCDATRDTCGPSDTCQPYGATGSSCNLDLHCQMGLVCIGVAGRPGACAEPGQAGDACAGSICADNLRCDASNGQAICRAPSEKNQPCDSSDACADFTVCAGLGADGGGTCLPVLDIGDRCQPSLNACPASDTCNPATNTCEAVPSVEGMPCSAGQYCGSLGLGLSLFCDPASGTCRDPLIPGEACDPSADARGGCRAGARCDDTTHVCVDATGCP